MLAVLAVLAATLFLLSVPASAQAADSGDRMSSFTGDFVLDADGGATVTETIDYVFGETGSARHGIYRSIVVRQEASDAQKQQVGSDDAYRYYALDVLGVTSPTGAPTKTKVTESGSSARIQIGDADKKVSGTQTYVIKYHLSHVMNAVDGNAEFFYNVFKDDAVPKDTVQLSVSGPGGVTNVRCALGDTDPGEPCTSAVDGNPATFTATGVQANEDLTIANQLPLAGFTNLAPDLRTGGSAVPSGAAKAITAAALAGGIGIPLVAAGVMGTLVATRGRDEWYAGITPGLTPGTAGAAGPPPAGSDGGGVTAAPVAQPPIVRGRTPTIAVQFNPPPGVQPGLVGTIIDESADTIDVSATVMDLAVRGYLQIEEVTGEGMFARTDWTLRRLTPPAGDQLRTYEQTVLSGLFETGDEVQLSDLKYRFSGTLKAAVSQMYREVVDRGWFRKSPETQRVVWQVLGGFLVAAGLFSVFFLGVFTIGIDRTGGWGVGLPSGAVLGLGLLIAGAIVLILGRRMPARTAEGSAVFAQSQGFRMYLETAEASQIRFEEASAIFSRYLPYAIVFGVADRWAGTFQKVAEAAQAAGTPLLMPTWYLYNGAMFPNFAGIADGAGSFASSAGGTFAATQSTGSSGGSGFGGGGFSGGGIGGSSSGSW